MTENQINFFKATEKITQIAQTVDKKPFFKLGFLTLLASVSFAGILGFSYNAAVVYKGENAIEQTKTKYALEVAQAKKLEDTKIINMRNNINLGRAINVIKSIPKEDMANFITYLKYHQTMYDKRRDIISDALMGAEVHIGSYDGSEHTQLLQNTVTAHKKNYENLISTAQIVYNDLQNNTGKVFDDDVNKVFTLYSNYKSNLLTRNVDIEKSLHKYTYPDERGNAHYNEENSIVSKIRTSENEVEQNIIQVKPKL
jgi:hypothetical protein